MDETSEWLEKFTGRLKIFKEKFRRRCNAV